VGYLTLWCVLVCACVCVCVCVCLRVCVCVCACDHNQGLLLGPMGLDWKFSHDVIFSAFHPLQVHTHTHAMLC
jgi:hypothetical protein